MKTFKEMENTFYTGVRQQLLAGLVQCTEEQQHFFNRMYAHGHLDWSMKKTVSQLPRDSLNLVMQQVQRTLDKNLLLPGRAP